MWQVIISPEEAHSSVELIFGCGDKLDFFHQKHRELD